MPSSQIIVILLMYLALATSEQFDITTIYRFQRTSSAVIHGFPASPSSYVHIEDCDADSCQWETNGWTTTYSHGIIGGLKPLTTPGTTQVKLQSLDRSWFFTKPLSVIIQSPSEAGEALLYFSSESSVLVVVIPFRTEYSTRSPRLYRCTNTVVSELVYSNIEGRCSAVNSQFVRVFYLEGSKNNRLQLSYQYEQLKIAYLSSPKLGLVTFDITDSELGEFTSFGASHSNYLADIQWTYSISELAFELAEESGEITSKYFPLFDSAICLAIIHYLKHTLLESDASIDVKIVLINGTEVSLGTAVAANNTEDYAWKTQLFYRDEDSSIGSGRIKVIAKKSSYSGVLIDSIRMCKPEDGNNPATINRESSIEVHARNNALGLPLMSGSGKILNANVAVDLEPCIAMEYGCNWELTDYAMIQESSPLTLSENGQSFSPTSAQASLVSQKFIPSYKKICVSVVSTDLTSSCKLEIVKMDGRTQTLTQKHGTSLGNGWNIRIYHGDTANILSPISIKLSECAFALLNRPRIQRIAGCSNEDLEDDIHIISASSDSSYMEYVAFEAAAVKDSSVDVSDSEDCLNGGLYDDKSHSCVCPPGFTGSSCEIGCGPDRYGSKCDGRCSRTTMGCMEMKLCRPKLGCSCAPGIKGILCDIPCSEYEYGAGCSQKCGNCEHSKSCDRYTGTCFSGCKDGFYAPYCQRSYKYLRVAPEVEALDFYTLHVSYDISTQYMEGVGKPRFHQLQLKDEMGEWKELLPVLLTDEEKFETNVTNLVPNMEYQIRAVLLDEDGNSYQGKDVPITKAFTKCTVPNEVNYNLTLLSVTESEFEVQWQYDDNMTWCKLVHFEVELKMGWKWQHHSSVKENYSRCYNLLPGETYQIRVRAMTAKGLVAYSEPFTVVTQDEAPEAVTALKVVSKTHSELELDWKEPFGKRGKIQGYRVSYKCVRLLGCSEVTCNDPGGRVEVVAPSISLHGLQPHAQYSISISARAAVYGTETFILAATDMTVPELAPTAPSDAVVSTNSSLTVQWKRPENCSGLNGYLHGFIYELYVQGNSAPVQQGKTKQTLITFTELTPHTHYIVKVYLHTSGGKNLNHPLVINASTRGSVPEKVQHLTVYKTGRRLIGLKWAGPREAYGDIHSFTISYGANNQKPIATVVKPTSCFAWPHLFCHTLNALKADTEYTIKVGARNTEVAEDGAVTEVAAVTKENAPLAPDYIRTVSQGETNLTIEWGLPRLLNGVLRSFLVNVEETDSHNISSCCSDFPIEEIPTRSEQGSYQKQLNNLKPASTYTVSVSGKTIALGPAVSMTTHTRPSVPFLEELVVVDSDEGIISESPSLIIKPLSNNHKLVSGYLLLVIPKSPSDNLRETSFQDDWLEHELKQKINGTFYVAAEFDQATLEEQSEVVLGTGNEMKNGKWSEVWDPILQDGQQYRFGLLVVIDYCGVLNIGYTETAAFKVES